MWHSLTASSSEHSAFTETADELMRTTSHTIVGLIGGLYVACFVVAGVLRPDILGAATWLLTILVVLNSALALWLNARRIWLAQMLWQAGIVLIITLAAALLHWPQLGLFYTLVPLLAAMTIGWWASALSELVVLVLLYFHVTGNSTPPLPSDLALLIGTISALGGLIGWAFANTLTTVTQWSLSSFDQANREAKNAQEHRGEMAHMVKALDHAYYRLERANAALVAARKEAEQAERFKTDFVSNVSHELRTPLNLIIGFSEVMITSPESYGDAVLPGAYRSDLSAIYHSAQHLLALVDDVLDLSRIEAGKIGLSREDVDPVALVAEAVDTLRDYIAKKRLTLKVDVAPVLARLSIDRLRIRQVLLNLLVNASRFTERGSITIEVAAYVDPVSAEGNTDSTAVAEARSRPAVIFRVRDTGHGIPADDLPKIFQEFQSTDAPLSKWHSGTGLGLPISRKFVNLHGGEMGVESVLGQGTTFWFTLPQSPGPTTAQAVQPGRWTPYVPLNDTQRAVVVANSDIRVAGLLNRYLEHFQVVGATTLEGGVALARDLQAIALLSDSAVPLAPGLDLLTIRCPLPSEQQAARAFGAQDYLVKPVAREDLLSAIERIGRPVRRVLIADDDLEIVQLFRRMLATHILPQDCLEANNGEDALQIMRTEAIDLVVLDLVMPGADGYSVLEHKAADPQLRAIPMIIASANNPDYVKMRLPGTIEIARPDGFCQGEVVQVIESVLSALAPGWRQLSTTAQAPETALPASPA